jgi:hypothetical protein
MRASWIEEKIKAGQVLVGWDGDERVGYIMGVDRYFKRDEVGIIHQLNVVPGRQRGLVGATLLKALFDRAAYGCRLFSCYCAQDLPANRFWEAMGFVPLAFRAGSQAKDRVHIFWQKRIREGDNVTPWWFPAKTDGGAMRADRIVLPIPLDKHWSDELPRLVPSEAKQLAPAPSAKKPKEKPARPVNLRDIGGMRFAPIAPVVSEKPKRQRAPKAKADPKLIAAARELRDRWLEQVNAGELLLPESGKYEVSRAALATAVADRASARLPALESRAA